VAGRHIGLVCFSLNRMLCSCFGISLQFKLTLVVAYALVTVSTSVLEAWAFGLRFSIVWLRDGFVRVEFCLEYVLLWCTSCLNLG